MLGFGIFFFHVILWCFWVYDFCKYAWHSYHLLFVFLDTPIILDQMSKILDLLNVEAFARCLVKYGLSLTELKKL